MQSMISLVRSNDPRWTTWTLAPLYKFLRIANVEVATIFLRKFEAKEDKKLAWAEEDDDEDLRRQTLPLDKRRSSRVISTRYSTHKKPVEDVSGSGSRTSIFSGVESGRVEKASVSRLSHVSKTHVPGGGGGGPKTVDGYQLIVVNDVVPNHSPDMFYFVKLRPVMVDRDNFFEDVLFGNIPGGYLTSLHSLMSYVLTPMFYQNGVLPESIANDFYASTNSFMSSITETHNRLLCQTVLYVPKEALSAPIDIVSKDKEICSRLEAAMVHWIRQYGFKKISIF
ncbi:uncharacterized protein LOC118436569 [Folsomia candida]|uniref:uncharacterized protein LOC118436569 n=1 Tax=Folsomia candida TaxID=158441 RepID=UPI001604EC1A|nr:uncharacterized protein LOC118436569 [Folsomia candida]